MIRFLFSLSIVLLLGWESCGTAKAETTRLTCSNTVVSFEFEQPEELRCLCATVESAIGFLRSVGLEATDEITVRIVNEIPSNLDHTLIGSFNSRSQEVKLLTFSRTSELTKKRNPIFDLEMTEELWCSYAAHEIAHAVSSRYLNPRVRNHTAGEYISAVTQLTVLPERIRRQILDNNKSAVPYQSLSEMSEIYFLFAPERFAVKCYLHFIALDNPADFIEQLTKTGTFY